jgi:hypothetical protein
MGELTEQKLRQALDFVAASTAALEEVFDSVRLLLRALINQFNLLRTAHNEQRESLLLLVQGVNQLRGFHGLPAVDPMTVVPGDPLPLLDPDQILPAILDRLAARRLELFALYRSQRPNEIKPWEAV